MNRQNNHSYEIFNRVVYILGVLALIVAIYFLRNTEYALAWSFLIMLGVLLPGVGLGWILKHFGKLH